MNKKLWVALALAVLGLGSAIQQKGDIPATAVDEKPASVQDREAQIEAVPDEPGTIPNSEDNGLAGQLVETLHADQEIVEVAIINSVECNDSTCTVELRCRGQEDLQNRMSNFVRAHPEFGTLLENRRRGKFKGDAVYPGSRETMSAERLPLFDLHSTHSLYSFGPQPGYC